MPTAEIKDYNVLINGKSFLKFQLNTNKNHTKILQR